MKRTPRLSVYVFCVITIVVLSQPISKRQRQISCQHRSTSGRDYVGEANTTVDGIPCQMWSDTNPHDHDFTHVGDHNFCRNPIHRESKGPKRHLGWWRRQGLTIFKNEKLLTFHLAHLYKI